MIETLLKGLAQSLSRHKIPYMIIGGQAVLLYGSPRLTRDIDITLGVDTEAYENISQICRELHLRKLPRKPKEFALETKVLPTEDPNSKFRVDFIFSNTPYERKAIQRAKRVSLKGTQVCFASLEDLVIHKLFAGRAVDLEDVKTVLIRNKKKADIRYIRRWLSEFSKRSEKKDLLTLFHRIWKSI